MADVEAMVITLDQFRAHVCDLAIQVAQYRDDRLTEAETAAMLDVYQEFGR